MFAVERKVCGNLSRSQFGSGTEYVRCEGVGAEIQVLKNCGGLQLIVLRKR